MGLRGRDAEAAYDSEAELHEDLTDIHYTLACRPLGRPAGTDADHEPGEEETTPVHLRS